MSVSEHWLDDIDVEPYEGGSADWRGDHVGQSVRKLGAGKETVKVPRPKESDDEAGYTNPAGDELSRIVAIIQDDTFANEQAMARAILAEAFKIVLDRDWYTVYRGGNCFEGLANSETKIRNWADKRIHPNEFRTYAKVSGPGAIERRQMEANLEIEMDERRLLWPSTDCVECGHNGSMHVVLLGKAKPGVQASPGKCTGPGRVPGPQVDGAIRTAGLKLCGCNVAIRPKA